MTYKYDYTLPDELLAQITEKGFEALPELIRTIINTAMQIERQNHLGVGPYEWSPERRDQANGYKPKTMATRVGKITFDVPQVRESDFYPHSLEKGDMHLEKNAHCDRRRVLKVEASMTGNLG